VIVTDASAIIEFLVNGDKAGAIRARIRAERQLGAPYLLDVEVAQVLRRMTAAKLISEGDARGCLDDLGKLPLVRYPHTPLLTRAFDLRANVTFYDAMYLVLAEALDVPLLTCDRALATIGRHRARVLVE
jgi:predicted nucleic acid-binding protein